MCLAASRLGGARADPDAPPFLAYLCFFSYAAALDGDFAPHAYYPRLRTLLGEAPTAGAYANFERVRPLWDDLEEWSCVERRGELGMFVPRWYVKWKHVGLPMGQNLLAEEELRALPLIFAEAALDPTSPPPRAELQRVLLKHASLFRSRTTRLLRNLGADEETARDALLEAVSLELSEWDGCGGIEGVDQLTKNGSLRLCCHLDSTANRAQFSYRCKVAVQLPEDGLDLVETKHAGEKLFCDEESTGQGWSTELQRSNGVNFAASECDWTVTQSFVDVRQGWTLRHRGQIVRVLVSGGQFGLPGYIEVSRLPSASAVQVLVHAQARSAVDRWGTESCDGWRQVPARGVPDSWHLFVADQVRSDESIRRSYPILSLPKDTKIHLVGGVRVDRTDRYFSFSPPSIWVEGPAGYGLTCDNSQMIQGSDGKFCFENASLGGRRILEVKRDELVVSRRSLFLDKEALETADVQMHTWMSGDGTENAEPGTPAACCAIVRDLDAEPFSFVGALPVLEWANVHYIGRHPGQISTWPEEQLPQDWSPVWVVLSRRKGQVQFCRPNLENAGPSNNPVGDRHRVKLWKEFLWHKRKVISPPANPNLKTLWEEYQEVARRI